jgi:hypothetical protein
MNLLSSTDKFQNQNVFDNFDWLSGTIGTFSVTNSKVSIGYPMTSATNRKVRIELYRHRFRSVTECPKLNFLFTSRSLITRKQINVNRPFVYLIRDDETELILFIGRVNDPNKNWKTVLVFFLTLLLWQCRITYDHTIMIDLFWMIKLKPVSCFSLLSYLFNTGSKQFHCCLPIQKWW